jgi:sulfur carrier protein ThiS
MRLYLGGHLGWYDAQKRKWIDVPLAQPTRLIDVLNDLKIPPAEIAVSAINGASLFALDDVIVSDDDTVELFPPVGGG